MQNAHIAALEAIARKGNEPTAHRKLAAAALKVSTDPKAWARRNSNRAAAIAAYAKRAQS